MQREKNAPIKGRAIAVWIIASSACAGHAYAQDDETVSAAHVQSSDAAQPLISLPTTPTPSPVGRTTPLPAANGAPLSPRGTVNASEALEKSATLAGTPRARTVDVTSEKPLDDALGGAVTTDTVTLAGQDFYNWFAQAWGAIPLSERYIVSVHERPSARYGSLVWVEFGQRRVFQAFLPIARANVRPVAEGAAHVAFQNVMQADLTRLLFRDADMANDEL
ncbi:CsgE family curli-type amyloid fiber assembly protein [Caballeronia sp. LZ062]|uniref:CsgE family curli-type amyloid fiber assembly protein n=1 Tax=unclassified Caballeronia TaxID=2646786 RepID=UPI00285C4644|nr:MULTISPECIES: CsgE family curli-type amyloid fiber assembly protein [unclassified Caballeronia]MDR5856138.1 CsgE family curli-type amyloid fiber assembly protein [Caballeronia sp. LZ050]MDR5872809.1 CsgE family curli-type amyloid fiber assembly protein [Caballeronia sp. LZ062]